MNAQHRNAYAMIDTLPLYWHDDAPTFGEQDCPALQALQDMVDECLDRNGVGQVTMRVDDGAANSVDLSVALFVLRAPVDPDKDTVCQIEFRADSGRAWIAEPMFMMHEHEYKAPLYTFAGWDVFE